VQASDWAFEDDSGGLERAPAKSGRRRQQISDSHESDSEDSTDDSDSETDRKYARNARKGPSSGRPTNGGAPYRQQQTARVGRKDYAGSSNPRRVKNYAGNPAGRGSLQEDDVSFKKNALLPRKGKRGKLSASAEQDAYDNLFNSIFEGVDPNGSAPAQAQQGFNTQPVLFSAFSSDEEEEEEKSEPDERMDDLWEDMDLAMEEVMPALTLCYANAALIILLL
jgi:hypothetical protein